jgi:threonine/homoserine/homoserine lactone efflux protein
LEQAITGTGYSNLLAFAWTSLLIELTPGPNMTYLAILALTEGRRAGFAAVGGIALGLLIVGLAAALGLAAIVSNSPFLYQALRWAGVAYLFWIAWEAWRGSEMEPSAQARQEFDGRHYFRQGLLTNLLNPKACVFYISILPLFIVAGEPARSQTLTLTLVYVAIATLVHLSIVSLAGSAKTLLENTRASGFIRRLLAAMLAAVAVWLAWTTRST